MHEPAVSATITNWNGRHYLEDCIQALLDQTHPLAEIIVVDNNSDDGSVAFVAERFPGVKIVQMGSNEGPCPARNAGLEAATHDLVLQVDNDAMLHESCLEDLIQHLEDDVAVVQPRSVFDSERDRVHYDGASMHYVGMMTLHNFYAPLEEADQEPIDVDAAISVALLMRKAEILESGGYDPVHFILFEDHDLSYRLRSMGKRIRHVPQAIVFHREGTAGISFREKGSYSKRRVFLHSRNRWIVILKNHSLRALILGIPGFFFYESAYVFFALKNGCLGAWIHGKWKLVGLLGHILRERKKVQERRVLNDAKILGAGSLTISPLIERKGLVAKAQRVLDSLLKGWWALVRNLA